MTETLTTRATLTAEHFNALIRHMQSVELQQLYAERTLLALIARRDAYYADIAAQYGLPARFTTYRFNEDTLEIEVT